MGKITLFTHKNNARSIVNDTSLAQSATTLNVATGDGARFPSTFPFRITIWDEVKYPNPYDDSNMEIVECTARTTDALTIVRAEEDTSDVAHAQGQVVKQIITSEVLQRIEQATPHERNTSLFAKQIWGNHTTWYIIPETIVKLNSAYYANCDIYVEAVIKNNDGHTASVKLYNETDSADVANSEISTVETDPTIVRGASAITLATGDKVYRAECKSSDASGWLNVYSIRLVFIYKA